MGRKKSKSKSKKDKKDTEGDDTGPETSDEVARIYWKWFSSDRIVFRGRMTSRSKFLPKCGKMRR